MEKTIELISGKLNNVEKDLSRVKGVVDHNAELLNKVMGVVDENADINNDNFDYVYTFINNSKGAAKEVLKFMKSQSKFNKLMFVGLIASGYILYKQDKAIKELQAKNEEQVTTEE